MAFVNIVTERRVTVLMVTVAVVLFGLVSLNKLPLNLLPNLSYPTLTVRTQLTGAAPQEIESLLSKPIEDAVGVIDDVRQVRSVSRSGQSDVIIEFSWGTAMDRASIDVREKIDIVELPLEAKRPILLRFDPSTEPIQRIALTVEESVNADGKAPLEFTDDVDRLRKLRRYAEDQLKNRFEAVDGTAAIKVSGGLEDEVQITLDQGLLSQLGLSVQAVANRLKAENVNLAGGRLEQGEERFLVRTVNEFKSIDAMAEAIVATVDERPVYLSDIGRVEQGFKDREAITRVNGREAVELAVYKEGDSNTVQVAQRMREALDKESKNLPGNLNLTVVSDQSVFISAAIRQVRNAAIVGALLAVLVLYGFLRDARSTSIIALAIPISVVGTFMAMFAAGTTLNIMSLGGIALAIGLLVDNSIVVLENIYRQREMGKDVLTAARVGTQGVAGAVTAATLTTVAVFLPMIFVTGIAGQLFRDQAVTVTFALLLSLGVALGLIPMLSSLAAGPRYGAVAHEGPGNAVTRFMGRLVGLAGIAFRAVGNWFALVLGPITWAVGTSLQGVRGWYGRAIGWSLAHPKSVLAGALLVFVLSLAMIPRLGSELIPELSQGEVELNLRATPGTVLNETDSLLRQVERIARDHSNVNLTYSVAGTGNRLDANPVDAGEHAGTLTLRLDSSGTAEGNVLDEVRAVVERIPGVTYEFSAPELLNFEAPIAVEVAGYDLDVIDGVAAQIRNRLLQIDRLTDVTTTSETGNPEIQIVFDQQRAAQLGLAVRDIADQVVSGVRGSLATRYSWRDKEIDVIVKTLDNRKASIEEINNLVVNPASERPVTLEALADVRVASGPAEIRRIDQARVSVVSANLNFGDLGSAVAEVKRTLNQIPLPQGINIQVTGQNEEMEASIGSLQLALAMAVFLVYLVMASQFESLRQPLIILFTIPLALVGAIWGLFVTGTPINVIALLGVIMLTGIVVNNAIVLVDLINQLRRQGEERLRAIREACEARLRPILMTTTTTVLGLLPMALGFGEGAEIRAPMAITVIGGLVTSTALTLVVIPVAYSLVERRAYLAGTQGMPAGAQP